MEDIVIIYSTFADFDSADHLRKLLIEKRVVACGNILEANSCYTWQGAITTDNEIVLICKTSKIAANKALNLLEQYHPYEVPCILHWEVRANKAYYNWVVEQL